MVTAPVLEVEGLQRRYGGRVVLHLDHLALHSGEVVAVLGPNGSGKSTLFRLLLFLERADAGRIRLRGNEVRRADQALRRQMAGVFQRPYLFAGTVRQNVEYGLRARGLKAHERGPRAEAVLTDLGLSGLAARHVRSLSGGEAQRVALARTLVLEPDVLLLDEPTANLDVTLQRQLREDLRKVSRARAGSVLLITHDPADAFALADRIAVLQEGRIVQTARPDDLVVSPATPFIAAFSGAELLLDGVVEGGDEDLVCVRLAPSVTVWAVSHQRLANGARVQLGYRPEDVVLSAPGTMPETSARNHFTLRVVTLTPSGGLMRVGLDGVIKLAAIVTRRSATDLQLAAGIEVNAQVKAAALHVFAVSA